MTNPKDIADGFSSFYSRLYNLSQSASEPNPTSQQINDFLTPLQLPTITPTQLKYLSQPFSHQEISKAIKALPLHKAPGPDGFINEYYKSFQDQLVPHLCNTFNKFLTTGEIPSESLEAVITTIHKPGKPFQDPANYRPISLLNTDLKIYTKLLATRLAEYMPALIHPDQVGFIPCRQASDATRRFIDLIHWAEHRRTPSLLISLDAEKAFD